ncbi:MFS transporter [Dyella caseinilytica]|uniref:MFS transporter n=1 Tax=Dyella caseinilytica TaxID=1849581 RepID=A0ABX7GX87_9GAMM|nr:MFS transporter [Dyella caseinilytica]QRN53810.1 MFS transporter [Dyella caseinilytica]GFZ89353.1 MFS transporter [Dyella caseinilytica]
MNQRSFHRGIARVTTATSFGFALVQLDVTIVNVALPRMATDLHAGVAGLQWVVDAYALTFAVLLLGMGYLGDRLGARKVYLAGMALFGLASVLCGCATHAVTLIIGRALQGLGAAAMMPCSLALLSHATAHEHSLRARAVGWWTAAGSITIAAGPIVGGLLMSVANWRSIFFVNIPVCLLGAWLTLRVPETEHKSKHKHFDLPGQLLAILALTGLTTAVIEVHPLGWTHPLVLSCIAIVLICVPWFLRVESRSPAPMLPLHFFRAHGFSAAVLYGIVMNFTYYGIVFLLSLYLQRVHGYSALRTGLAYLPLTATFFGVNIFSGWLVGAVGARLPMVLGALIDAAGFGLFLLLGAASPYLLMLPAFALLPSGMGLGVPAMTTTVLSAVEKEASGTASGVLNSARQAAGAMGVALFGALAGDSNALIVRGLHVSSLISVVLLLMVAVLAFRTISAVVVRKDGSADVVEY